MSRGLKARYWEAVVAYKWHWSAVVVGDIVFFSFNGVVTPYVYARFIEKISAITASTKLSDFYAIVAFMVGVHIFQTSWGQWALYSFRRALPLSIKYLEDTAFHHVMLKSAGFFANNFTGSLVTKFNRYSRSFQSLADIISFDLVEIGINFVLPFIFMLFVAPHIALIFLVFTIIMATSLFFMHRRKIPYSRAVAAQESLKTGLLADAVTNIMSVKTFSSRHAEEKTYQSATSKWARLSYTNLAYGNYIRVYKISIWTIAEACIMLFVAKQALEGSLSIANAAAIMIYVRQLASTLWNFGKIVEQVEQSVADATEMVDILDEPLGVADIEKPLRFKPNAGSIVFESVNFKYEDLGSSEVFRKLNLSIQARQKIGLVGPSGGGKTTFVKLLLRFADVQSGTILIDGVDISQVAQDDLRRSIAYVPQEPILFHRTLAENITYGAGEVSSQKLKEIIQLSHVDEFAQDLPNGLDTMVGERGVKLSGGQKQRIAIARAMLKPAPIVLLDEATSALDSRSEKLIVSALDNLMKGRTTIVIAHRLSTIKKLDRIIVLDRGEIKEDGTHNQLLKKKGLYANLWDHQMGNFIE